MGTTTTDGTAAQPDRDRVSEGDAAVQEWKDWRSVRMHRLLPVRMCWVWDRSAGE